MATDNRRGDTEKLGVYDIEKMRTIQLMNAEFNMNNKMLGRDMMKAAKKTEQYQENNIDAETVTVQ